MWSACLVNLVAPMITTEVEDQAQNEGSTVSFTCRADGKSVPTISWYFNGVITTHKYLDCRISYRLLV